MEKLSLLLVEDNVLNQKLIFLNLTKYNFVIDIANNGFEAVEKFKEHKYSLVLMDVMMPVMDGFEATRLMRKIEEGRKGHTPIVGLTANTYDGDKDKCLAAGMDHYMTKPFDFRVLKEIFAELGIDYKG